MRDDLGSWHEASQQGDGHPALWDRADEAYTADLLSRVFEDADQVDSCLMKDRSLLGADPSAGTVSKVKYFTSQVSEKAAEDPDAPRRQRVLIRAVRATGVEVLEGKFKVPDDWRAISSKGDWEDRLRPPVVGRDARRLPRPLRDP